MPMYEYVCKACGKDFVVQQPTTAKVEETACPFCNERQAEKKISSFSSKGGDRSNCDRGYSRSGG